MNKGLFLAGTLLVLFFKINIQSYAQVAPYALSPKWYFGNQAGLNFTAGAPTVLAGGATDWRAFETTSTICDQNGNVVFYTDSYRLFDAAGTVISTLNGGCSSTQSSVCIPDPANIANRYYLFTANVDDGGGGDRPASTTNLGIHWYYIQKSGLSVSILAGPVKVANHDEVSEQITLSSDGNGGYWVIAHQGGDYSAWNKNEFWAWPVTASGVGTKSTSSVPGTTGNEVWHGSIKVNKCQTRLGASFASGNVEVYNWDMTTGKVTSLIRNVTGYPALYGGEFSPDGNMFYFTTNSNNKLYQLDVATGTVTTDPTWISSNNDPKMGTLQLGPDDKLYVTNASNGATPSYIGVVNNPNVSGLGCNYNRTGFMLNNGSGVLPNYTWGMSNISWINPPNPVITNSGCYVNHQLGFDFKTYFGSDITIIANTIEWNFGSGYVPGPKDITYTFPGNGTYTVSVRFKDQTCNRQWTATKIITMNCSLNVEWLDFKGSEEGGKIKLLWSTATETNNDYFVIERSGDGIHFEEIGKADGNGITNKTSSYLFYDEHPLAGGNYYRLKQVDYSGESSYSKVVSVEHQGVSLRVFPNPSNTEFKINISGADKGKVIVINALGQEVFQAPVSSDLSFGSTLPDGAYLVKVIAGDEILLEKVVKY
ncbi:MAG: T9SS type A sorting domain-containing protein [Cytophagaceae bacterium]